jgi:hypothetical protein
MKAGGIYVGGLCLVAAAAGMGLFLARRTNAGLEAQVTRLSRQNADLRYELKQASRQAADIGQRAVELDTELGSAKVRTTATETKNVQLARQLTEREQREVALMAELATLRQPAAAPSPSEEPVVLPTLILTASPTPPRATPPQPQPVTEVDVAPYRQRIAELEEQLTRLLTRALAETIPEPVAPDPEPTPAPHQVVRVGPAAAFVVLDYGQAHGARPQAIIRLQRGTSELAQVQISDVRPRFSLAQVLPGTLKGQLQTGDLVVFTQ